jgi:hypothetical protein
VDVRNAEKAAAEAETLRRAKAEEEWKRTEPERRAKAAAAAAAAKAAAEAEALRRAKAEEEWKRTEAERRAKAAAERRRAALLSYLHLIWMVPIFGFGGAMVGMILGGIGGAFMEGITAAHGSDVGTEVGVWLGVLVALIVATINARGKLSEGKSHLTMHDAVAIAIATTLVGVAIVHSVPSGPPVAPPPKGRVVPRLKEAMDKAKIVQGRPGETITVVAPADGSWVKVYGGRISVPHANVYWGNETVELHDGPTRPILMNPLGGWVAVRSAGVKPVTLTITFVW